MTNPVMSQLMNPHLLEERLIDLRNRIAALYGEDLAQEMVIRVLLRPELSNPQVMTKAKWLSQNHAKRESRRVLMDDEQLGMLWNCDDTWRIHARIELRCLCEKSKRIEKLVRVELGLCVFSRQRESFIRAANRSRKNESL